MTPKIFHFLAKQQPATPCLAVDLDVVRQNYLALQSAIPQGQIYYAVKANPAPAILSYLAKQGACFDVASLGEITLCLQTGIPATRLSYGHTAKPAHAIAHAHELGISLFAFDSPEELEKIARHAPGARVFCRIAVANHGANWPLSRKFGTECASATLLLSKAQEMGLKPIGLSFHVGSQQNNVNAYTEAILKTGPLFQQLRKKGIALQLLNLGGGFPSTYTEEVPSITAFGAAIHKALTVCFDDDPPHIMLEPGRYMVGNAGVISTEVILACRRGQDKETPRWIYLDIGRFGGLAETEGEAIRYPFQTDYNSTAPCSPCILAGPTCDSADVLYEKNPVMLPNALKSGDRITILGTGAYVSTYCSTGFNGFAPLTEHYL